MSATRPFWRGPVETSPDWCLLLQRSLEKAEAVGRLHRRRDRESDIGRPAGVRTHARTHKRKAGRGRKGKAQGRDSHVF